MDTERAARIEQKLDDLVASTVPRIELDRRLDRLEDKLDRGLSELAEHGEQLAIVSTKLEQHEGLQERLSDVENVAYVHRRRDNSRGWLVPTVLNAVGILISTVIAVGTFLVTGHHHG